MAHQLTKQKPMNRNRYQKAAKFDKTLDQIFNTIEIAIIIALALGIAIYA